MKKNIRLLVLFLFVLLLPGLSFAQTQNNPEGQGLTISPVLLERQMEKNQTLEESIQITNTSSKTLPIKIEINDFLPQGENGQPIYVPAGKTDKRFSLSSWLTLKNSPELVLDPGQHTQVQFSITPPADADNGGHYGAILFSFQGASVEGSAVQVTQKIAAIILVKLGLATEDGQITNFSAEKSFYQAGPVTLLTKFKNLGNVHVKPRGGISITNMFGKKIATLLVNETGNNVLAGNEREFKSIWQLSRGFGRYTALAQISYGDTGALITVRNNFWIIPLKTVGGFGIMAVLLALLAIFGIKRYNQWLLTQAGIYQRNKQSRKKEKKG